LYPGMVKAPANWYAISSNVERNRLLCLLLICSMYTVGRQR